MEKSNQKFQTTESSKADSKQRMYSNISGPRKKLPIGYLLQQERMNEYPVVTNS